MARRFAVTLVLAGIVGVFCAPQTEGDRLARNDGAYVSLVEMAEERNDMVQSLSDLVDSGVPRGLELLKKHATPVVSKKQHAVVSKAPVASSKGKVPVTSKGKGPVLTPKSKSKKVKTKPVYNLPKKRPAVVTPIEKAHFVDSKNTVLHKKPVIKTKKAKKTPAVSSKAPYVSSKAPVTGKCNGKSCPRWLQSAKARSYGKGTYSAGLSKGSPVKVKYVGKPKKVKKAQVPVNVKVPVTQSKFVPTAPRVAPKKQKTMKKATPVVSKAPIVSKGPIVSSKAPISKSEPATKKWKPIVAKRVAPKKKTAVVGKAPTCGKHCFNRMLEAKKGALNVRPVPARSYNKRTYVAPVVSKRVFEPKIKTRKGKKVHAPKPVSKKSAPVAKKCSGKGCH